MSENKPLSLPGTTPQGSVIGADRAPNNSAVSPELEAMALVIATAYMGRPVEMEFITKPATGGYVFVECARAALLALREPSEGMVLAMPFGAASSWTDAIDHILGETK